VILKNENLDNPSERLKINDNDGDFKNKFTINANKRLFITWMAILKQ
jgi:hypothetical protein